MEESLKYKELELTKNVSNTLSDEDELVEKIIKRVIPEITKRVIAEIDPLLEKLQKVVGAESPSKQPQQVPILDPNVQKLSNEERLDEIQSTASRKMKLLEQRIAKRIGQM